MGKRSSLQLDDKEAWRLRVVRVCVLRDISMCICDCLAYEFQNLIYVPLCLCAFVWRRNSCMKQESVNGF